MAQHKRQVTYVVPPPTEPVPRLLLPPHGTPKLGVVGPVLTPVSAQNEPSDVHIPSAPRHPRHRLGIASLALDVSTQLAGKASPEGILYSGGRDGLIISWDLGIPTSKRNTDRSNTAHGRWEMLTGWEDDIIDEENEDGEERIVSDGDILGEVTPRRQKTLQRGEIPYEQQWEIDTSTFKPGTFRQCAEAHFDWVNDIALCNYNQTVVSASSDGTIKAWNPHSTTDSDPTRIGSHSDYVRCVTYCREQNWVASGSFDRTVKIWDLNISAAKKPVITLNPPDATAPKSSIYAVACDPYGRTIASGSPERVVRLWDPRSGKRTGKLVGHTDNIRAILISEDGKYLLTGSADASIKLWSLSSQRCLHTFTHHADSVWSLFSTHPSLEVFYSGDRSGFVCRVDVEDCSDISQGECIVLCQDSSESTRLGSEGINKIVAMDDNLLWTASGTSSVKRWHIPPRRAVRPTPSISTDAEGERIPFAESPTLRKRLNTVDISSEAITRPSTGHSPRTSFAASVHSLSSEHHPHHPSHDQSGTLSGIPMDSLVKLVSPNDPFTPFPSSRYRDPEVATLYSAASVMSVPLGAAKPRGNTLPNQSPARSLFQHQQLPPAPPLHSSRTDDTFATTFAVNNIRAKYEERELAADAVPLVSEPDDLIQGDHGLVRSVILNDRIHALTVDTSGEVAVWDIVRAMCKGRFSREDVVAASHRGSTVSECNDEKERSPREALEVVRERIEGEAAINSWCTSDTKAGVLAIHVTDNCFNAEIYADEVGFSYDKHFTDDTKLNIGKWVLRNLFINYIREEQRMRRVGEMQDGILAPSLGRTAGGHRSSSESQRASRRTSMSPESTRKAHRPSNSHVIINSSRMIPAIAPHVSSTARSSPLIAPLIPLHKHQLSQPESEGIGPLAISSRTRSQASENASGHTHTSVSIAQGSTSFNQQRQASFQGNNPAGSSSNPPSLPSASQTDDSKNEAQMPVPHIGLMGRLKSFGRSATKRPVSDGAMSSPNLGNTSPAVEAARPTENFESSNNVNITKSPLQALLAGPLTPPTSAEVPLHYIPPNTSVFITEEGLPSYNIIYRGTAGTTHLDVQVLEETIPMWLAEYLLLNKIPPLTPQAKVSFVLLPWNKNPHMEPLPELLNTQQSKLTASRYLRVRKIVYHVHDKIEKLTSNSRATSIRLSMEEERAHSRSGSVKVKPEEEYEILCNETLLPLTMTLASVKKYVWKQNSELVMYYRKKHGITVTGEQIA